MRNVNNERTVANFDIYSKRLDALPYTYSVTYTMPLECPLELPKGKIITGIVVSCLTVLQWVKRLNDGKT